MNALKYQSHIPLPQGGLKNAMFEANVQVDFYKMGFLSLFEMIRNVSVGFVIRMLPSVLMKAMNFIKHFIVIPITQTASTHYCIKGLICKR
jgi:hypothetical protein